MGRVDYLTYLMETYPAETPMSDVIAAEFERCRCDLDAWRERKREAAEQAPRPGAIRIPAIKGEVADEPYEARNEAALGQPVRRDGGPPNA